MFLFNIFEIFHAFIPYNVAFFGRNLGLKVAMALFLSIGMSELVVVMPLWGIKVLV